MKRLAENASKSVLLVVVLMASMAAAAQAQYRVTRIVATHSESVLPRAVNNNGQTVGSSGEPHGGDTIGFMAQRGGRGLTLAVLPGGDYSEAFGINDAGDVVGSSNTTTTVRPVRWSGDSVIALPLPAGMTGGEAFAINKTGSIAGYASGPAGAQAAVWAPDGSVRLLGTRSASQTSQASAINSTGDAAGVVEKNGLSQGFLWTASNGMTLLTGADSTKANAINDSRDVVGACSGTEGQRACLWTASGLERLGTLAGAGYSEAFGINNAGTVVGSADTSLGLRAFVWTRADGMRDLNSLIPSSAAIVLSSAIAINERGEILAYGSLHHDLSQDRNVDLDHGVHAGPTFVFLLTPTR